MRNWIRAILCLAAALPCFALCADRTDYFLDVVLADASGAPLPVETGVRIGLMAFPQTQSRPEIRDHGKASRIANGVYRICIPKGEGVALKATWVITISADRFRDGSIGPTAIDADGERLMQASKRPIAMTLIRDPKQWDARFRCSADFGDNAYFSRLESTFAGDVYLAQHGFWKKPFVNLGSLAGSSFSDVKPKDDVKLDRDAINRARAALLNIYHALTTNASCGGGPAADRDWFSFVKEIHVIDGERFIGKAKTKEEAGGEDVFELVQRQGEQFQGFACNTSVAAPPLLHRFQDPRSAHWGNARARWESASVKTPLCQGNVEVTVARFEGETLLDFDIDEHFAVLLHLADVGKHLATRGTDAYEMAEMLALRDRNLGRLFDPGFSLTPRPAPAVAACPSDRPALRTPVGAAPVH